MQRKDVAEKAQKSREETFSEKYGNSSWTSTDIFKQKCEETFMERYGVSSIGEYTSKILTEEERLNIAKKAGDTMFERYGSRSVSGVPEFQEKAKKTCLEKYGVDNYHKTKESIEGFTNLMKSLWENAKDIHCDYCNKVSKNWSNMKRYHGDKCKENPKNKIPEDPNKIVWVNDGSKEQTFRVKDIPHGWVRGRITTKKPSKS
jgi:hypothetical protein